MRRFAMFNKSSTNSKTEGYTVIPVENFLGAHPVDDNNIVLCFKPMDKTDDHPGQSTVQVQLTLSAANKHADFIADLAEEFSTGESIYITIADDETSTYFSSFIDSIDSITFSPEGSSAGWNGHVTRIKILPRDFIADDIGRPAQIDDTGSDRWVESYGTAKLFASVPIPTNCEAASLIIYGSATSAITVYEADINSKTVTSLGTGNIGTTIDITDITSDDTNYLLIEMAQASGEEVYGGFVTFRGIAN